MNGRGSYAPGGTTLHRTGDPNNALGNGTAVHNRLGDGKANGAVVSFGRSRSRGATVADRPIAAGRTGREGCSGPGHWNDTAYSCSSWPSARSDQDDLAPTPLR